MIYETARFIRQIMAGDEEKEKRQKQIDKQLAIQRGATSYEEWLGASQTLDTLLGNDEWKSHKESGVYYYRVVEFRLTQLREARLKGDNDQLIYLLRTTLQRNLGNMGDTKLYQNSFTGTKRLIEDYISECELAMNTLMNSDVDHAKLLSALIQTRKAFGRTALVLSGGSTFGILHIGVVKELYYQNLLPRIISGSSAGSIIASVLSIHVDEEIEQLLKLPIFSEDFDIFEETGNEESTMDRLARFLKYGTWFDNKYLSRTLRELLGDLTFQEAYYRTRRVLNVTVSSASVHEMPRLLNYLTAPNVLIWSAVCASCSVPIVFSSYDILAKHPKTGEHYSWNPSTFIDGSVDNDLPLGRLSEMFNVNHFIACQVNPHIVPFIHLNQTIESLDKDEKDDTKWRDAWNSAQGIVRNEISHFFHMLSECGVLKNTSSKLRSVLSQQYSGDITILPEILISEFGQLFKNPTKEFFANAELRAAQATWPKMSLIRNHCAIELALDRAIHKLRIRLIPETKFSSSTLSQLSSASPQARSHHQRNQYQHHQRRKSDGLAVKFLGRRGNSFDFGPHAMIRKSSSINLHNMHFSKTMPPSRRSSVSKMNNGPTTPPGHP